MLNIINNNNFNQLLILSTSNPIQVVSIFHFPYSSVQVSMQITRKPARNIDFHTRGRHKKRPTPPLTWVKTSMNLDVNDFSL